MSAVIGQGVVEVSADASKLSAGIDGAKRKIRELGDESSKTSERSSRSIDRYVKSLQTQNATLGMSASEAELYRLRLRGASAAQLEAASSALALNNAYRDGERIGQQLRAGFITLAAVAGTALIGAAVAFDSLIKKASEFQDLAEKTGDTASNISSLAVAASGAGVELDTVANASIKLNKGLIGVDDETKSAGAALAALGINLEAFKQLGAADQIEQVGKAMAGFADSTAKSQLAVALFGKSGAELLPFLKDISDEGVRQLRLSDEQIAAADDYGQAQGRLGAAISLTAQGIAIGLLPTVTSLTSTIGRLAKDQDIASTAAEVLQGALNGGIVIFQTIAIVAANVGFVFQGVGREIGAIAAQLVALATLDFSGFSAISQAVSEDAARARGTLDKFEKEILSIGQPQPGAAPNAPAVPRPVLPEVVFNGPRPDGKAAAAKAAAEAKAQLDADLSAIQRAAAEEISILRGKASITEALRSASLISEEKYYAARRDFITANNDIESAALRDEIARRTQEASAGKGTIENTSKIADLTAKLAKIRRESADALTVLAIKEQDSGSKLAQYYRDATAESEAYLASVQREVSARTAGAGAGNRARAEQAELDAIATRASARRAEIERDRRNNPNFDNDPRAREKYEFELTLARSAQEQETAIARQGFADRLLASQDFYAGASEAIANYYEESQSVASKIEDVFTKAFKGAEDAIVSFARTGKLSFGDLASSIIEDLIRIQVQKSITGPLAAAFGGGDILGSLGSLLGFANGGRPPVGVPSIVGERGPELFVPNTSGTIIPNGAFGGGGMTVNIIESPGNGGKTSRRETPDGSVLDVFVEKVKASVAADISRGSGLIPGAMSDTYGLNRVAGAY